VYYFNNVLDLHNQQLNLCCLKQIPKRERRNPGKFTDKHPLDRTVKKLTEWEPCSSRSVGRPRLRWLDQVEEDLKKKKVRNWREKCKGRRLWNEIVK
jgi:hypothetical protein